MSDSNSKTGSLLLDELHSSETALPLDASPTLWLCVRRCRRRYKGGKTLIEKALKQRPSRLAAFFISAAPFAPLLPRKQRYRSTSSILPMHRR
jgi:hypothetical protein